MNPEHSSDENARVEVSKAAAILENNRCLITEHEASLHFAASLLSHPSGLPKKDDPKDAKDTMPTGVKDAWLALMENSYLEGSEQTADVEKNEEYEYPLPKGELGKANKTAALAASLKRASTVASILKKKRKADALSCVNALKSISKAKVDPSSGTTTPDWLFQEFYQKVKEIKEYHARHPSNQLMNKNSGLDNKYSLQEMIMGGSASTTVNHLLNHSKKRKLADTVADGYDLHSIIQDPLSKIKAGQIFSEEEVMGKYLDLNSCHHSFLTLSREAKRDETEDGDSSNISYPDFVAILASGLSNCKNFGEKEKMSHRKKYIRFLNELNTYLLDFLQRVSPLLDVQKEVIQPAISSFEDEWSQKGGIEGWTCKDEEKVLAKLGKGEEGKSDGINLKDFNSVEELMEKVTADQLKVELARLGMKCGGAPLDRAKRLWCARDTPLDKLPPKLFAKKKTKNDDNNSKTPGLELGGGNQRRIDIAKLEIIAAAMLDQLRPTLDATARRAERRLTQTINEKEKEVQEEINGAYDDSAGAGGADGDNDSDDSDDDDTPIYNPKGVPLGWDGKPIPYWLFKLHGLNHFYPCEICGNESYRGRHNFEKHFAEAKHSYGMKCLGIPNTKHFHGVTKIEDAQNLWRKLQENVNKDIFDASKEEEYEDSHGNVLSRATYEDLARQGLL